MASRPAGYAKIKFVNYADNPAQTWATEESLRRRLVSGTAEFTVQTPSMSPIARAGDSFVIKASATARPGDIVLAVTGGRALIHRLLSQRGGKFITKGDNAPAADPPAAVLIGVAQTLKKRDGKVFDLTTSGARALGRVIVTVSALEAFLARAGTNNRLVHAAFYLARRVVAFPLSY